MSNTVKLYTNTCRILHLQENQSIKVWQLVLASPDLIPTSTCRHLSVSTVNDVKQQILFKNVIKREIYRERVQSLSFKIPGTPLRGELHWYHTGVRDRNVSSQRHPVVRTFNSPHSGHFRCWQPQNIKHWHSNRKRCDSHFMTHIVWCKGGHCPCDDTPGCPCGPPGVFLQEPRRARTPYCPKYLSLSF